MKPEEYHSDRKFYNQVFYVLTVILIFVTIDLFYFAKSKEDVFEPYYQRLNKKEKEEKRRVYENKLKVADETNEMQRKDFKKRLEELNKSNMKKKSYGARLAAGFAKKD